MEDCSAVGYGVKRSKWIRFRTSLECYGGNCNIQPGKRGLNLDDWISALRRWRYDLPDWKCEMKNWPFSFKASLWLPFGYCLWFFFARWSTASRCTWVFVVTWGGSRENVIWQIWLSFFLLSFTQLNDESFPENCFENYLQVAAIFSTRCVPQFYVYVNRAAIVSLRWGTLDRLFVICIENIVKKQIRSHT